MSTYRIRLERGAPKRPPELPPSRYARAFTTVYAACPHVQARVVVWDKVHPGETEARAPDKALLFRMGARAHGIEAHRGVPPGAPHECCKCFEPFWAFYGPEYVYALHITERGIDLPGACGIEREGPMTDEDMALFVIDNRRARRVGGS